MRTYFDEFLGEATGETDIFWPRRAGNGHGLFADFTEAFGGIFGGPDEAEAKP